MDIVSIPIMRPPGPRMTVCSCSIMVVVCVPIVYVVPLKMTSVT